MVGLSIAPLTGSLEIGEKHAMIKKIWKGFSWIEIAVAVLLFVVVLVLTLPSFSRFQCLARQSEAKFELMRILAASELYKSDHGQYPSMQKLLDSGRVKLRKEHYSYEIKASEDGKQIVITAVGKAGSQVALDKWQVDGRKNLESVSDACAIKAGGTN
jgi:type II secretory pathway pseudopilin PulG